MYSLYLLAVAISACLLSLTKADEPLLINTNLGQVQGYIDAGGARLWKGKYIVYIIFFKIFF